MPSESPRTWPCEICGEDETLEQIARCAGELLHPCSRCGAPLGGDPAEVTLCAVCIVGSMRSMWA